MAGRAFHVYDSLHRNSGHQLLSFPDHAVGDAAVVVIFFVVNFVLHEVEPRRGFHAFRALRYTLTRVPF